MTTFKQQIQLILTLVIGLTLAAGVSYGYSTWVGPTATPPGDNTDAPINVGNETQTKAGAMNFNGVAQFNASIPLRITPGAGEGKVLTSNADGNARWADNTGGSGGGIPGNMEVFSTSGNINWTVPNGVSKVMIEAWGAGGGGARSYTSEGLLYSGQGGGGGAYTKKIIKVEPDKKFNLTIGKGGRGSKSRNLFSIDPGGDGGGTTVEYDGAIVIMSGGGKGGGDSNSLDPKTGLGGQGFDYAGNELILNGQKGEYASMQTYDSNGRIGSYTPGIGGDAGGFGGYDGGGDLKMPGGGGKGGGGGDPDLKVGFAGADGMVILYW